MQRRVLLLRRTSAESISDCMEGRPTALKVKQLRMDTPPPWSDTPWKLALTGLPLVKPDHPLVATEDRGQRRSFRFFCPWAACLVGSDASLPGGLDLCKARKYQLACSGCKARFAAARAACVFCHGPPQAGCTHTAQDAARDPPPGRKPGAYRGAGACPAGMRPTGPAADATCPEGRTMPTHSLGSTAPQGRQVSLADCWAGPASSGTQPDGGNCSYSYQCGRCQHTSALASISADAKGYLRPTRCKQCGHAGRPNNARCVGCDRAWQGCKSRPMAL